MPSPADIVDPTPPIVTRSQYERQGCTTELAVVDTVTGKVLAIIPTKLKFSNAAAGLSMSVAISDDGQYAYVSSSEGGLIQRFNISTSTFDLEWEASPSGPDRSISVGGIATISGSPESFVVSYHTPEGYLISIFDGGAKAS